jgi:hypothetical protein
MSACIKPFTGEHLAMMSVYRHKNKNLREVKKKKSVNNEKNRAKL